MESNLNTFISLGGFLLVAATIVWKGGGLHNSLKNIEAWLKDIDIKVDAHERKIAILYDRHHRRDDDDRSLG